MRAQHSRRYLLSFAMNLYPIISKRPKAISDEYTPQLEIWSLKPGEGGVFRLLPWIDEPEAPCAFLYEHVWPGPGIFEYNPVYAAQVCPEKTHPSLLKRPQKLDADDEDEPDEVGCIACLAGLDLRCSAIVFALSERPLGTVCLRFNQAQLPILKELIQAGCFEMDSGRRVKLWRDDRRLYFKFLERQPINNEEFQQQLGLLELSVAGWRINRRILKDMMEARDGWIKLGEPAPGASGDWRDLLPLLPGVTFIEMPLCMKSPHRANWQKTPYEAMLDFDYRRRLDCGNVGILFGRDEVAVKKGLIEDVVRVCLDADTERFARQVPEASPWLNDTFSVMGRPGRVKWIFEVAGAGMEACVKSRLVMREVPGGKDKKVGEWLAQSRQGVVLGAHPGGFFYQHNGKPILRVAPKDFSLPPGHYVSGGEVETTTTCSISRRLRRLSRQDDDRPQIKYEVLAEAVDAIDATYADNYETWLHVGFALRWWACQTGQEEQAYQLFCSFSRKSAKFDRDAVREKWVNLEKSASSRPITIGTLIHYASSSGFSFHSNWQQDNDDCEG